MPVDGLKNETRVTILEVRVLHISCVCQLLVNGYICNTYIYIYILMNHQFRS